MNTEEFREFGKVAVDYIADYMENIRDRKVLPEVESGFLQNQIPEEISQNGENWMDIMQDIDTIIMPGVTHWKSPQFHAYYPSIGSYPSIVGELLSSGLNCLGFSWMTSPVNTELEVKMMNWLGKLMALPEEFLNSSDGPGGGVIQGSASESTFIALLSAKNKSIEINMKASSTDRDPTLNKDEIQNKLVAYTSDQSNSSVEKAGKMANVTMRLLKPDKKGVLRGDAFLKAVQDDLEKGYIPCCLVATLGTTGTCAFDNLEELGPICNQYNIWLHIDAAYAGAVFILPEYRYLMKGVQYADSFVFNPHKWLLVNYECSAYWVKDIKYLMNTLFVDRIYLKHNDLPINTQTPDYRHWQIPLGRKFRALKLWITLRVYGANGLQEYIRKHISLANYFAEMVEKNDNFELVVPPSMGLVCFRVKGDNVRTKQLHDRLMLRKNIYLIVATLDEKLMLRFVICSQFTEKTDVEFAWNEIITQAQDIFNFSTEKNNTMTNVKEVRGLDIFEFSTEKNNTMKNVKEVRDFDIFNFSTEKIIQ